MGTGMGAVVEQTKKNKKKRGKNKWMPFRRPDAPVPQTKEPAEEETVSRSTKTKNKGFLDSSDDEEDTKEENIENKELSEENNENIDPENKENVAEKVVAEKVVEKKSPPKPIKMPPKLDRSRLLRLLNDDSDVGSDSEEDGDKTKRNGNDSGSSDEGVDDPNLGTSNSKKKNLKLKKKD